MSRRNLYITLITVCSILICVLLIVILTKGPKDGNSTLDGGSNNNGNHNGENNGGSTGTGNFSVVLERSSLNVGEKTKAIVVFQDGSTEPVRWYASGAQVSVSNTGEVVGIEYGTASVCAELVSNSKQYKCVQITVSNAKGDFKTKLVNTYGYTMVSDNKYVKDKYTLDLNNKTFTYRDTTTNDSMMSYHFARNENYVESVVKDPRYTVILRYTISIKQYDCQASPAAREEEICSNVKDQFIKNIGSMLLILEGYLQPEYNLNDIN